MIKRALVLLTLAGIYVWTKRKNKDASATPAAHEEEARWASEGGANPSATV